MPQINFLGKTFVQNYHLAVPYSELIPQKEKSITEKVRLDDNLIIHGDNLKALKALLPTYAGKIKCIYIDPPYNTGNEGWAYNDNVNNPRQKEWLGKVVDREDLTRHDKWLCMMMPRLKLLRELLSDDGAIFISIDDFEIHRLWVLMDEVFGEENYIGCITIEGNPRGRDYGGVARMHDYLLVYSKSYQTEINNLRDENKFFPYKDKTGGFEIRELRNRNIAFNKENRPNLYYPFYVNPQNKDENGFFEIDLVAHNNWVELFPKESQGLDTVWRWGKVKSKENLNTEIVGKSMGDGGYQIIEKYRKKERMARSMWFDKDVNTEKGTLLLKTIMGNKEFGFPKPVEMIKRVIEMGSGPDDIILDSFAGSGTTAHAVLDLNKEDGGNRKFILVECEDYADKITAERVRRVIKGVPNTKDEELKNGFGGTFSYFELGKPIELKSILEGKDLPSYLDMARYVFYTATGEEFDEKQIDESKNFIGESKNYKVFLFYKPDKTWLKNNPFTLDQGLALGSSNGKRNLVFAPNKYLNDDQLAELHIDFAQLPFEIYKLSK